MPLDRSAIEQISRDASSRVELWTALLRELGARTAAEVGVLRGDFAAAVLDACPDIERYVMLDPWRHLAGWKKPANHSDDVFARHLEETLAKTTAHAARRVVLRGTTAERADDIEDGSLDFVYIDGDHTLRGITVDLHRMFPKVREGGCIGGDDFRPSIWQHDERFEPTLVFPYAVHFAEAVGARIYGLPFGQFLLQRSPDAAFEFVDLTGRYGDLGLRAQLRPPDAGAPVAPPAPPPPRRALAGLRAARRTVRARLAWRRR